MRKRKTIDVRELKAKLNWLLSLDCIGAKEKQGVIALGEELLHNSGNYEGYRYPWYDPEEHGPIAGVLTPEREAHRKYH